MRKWPIFYYRTSSDKVIEISNQIYNTELVIMASLQGKDIDEWLSASSVRPIRSYFKFKVVNGLNIWLSQVWRQNSKSSCSQSDKIRLSCLAGLHKCVQKALLASGWANRDWRIRNKLLNSWLHDGIVYHVWRRLLDIHGCNLTVWDQNKEWLVPCYTKIR